MMRTTIAIAAVLAIMVSAVHAPAQDDPTSELRTIRIEGTETIVETGMSDGRPFARVSRDGGANYEALVPPSTTLNFQYAQHDPLVDRPAVPGMLRAGSAHRLFVVQFFTQPLREYRDGLEKLGVEIHHYLANQAYLVRMSSSRLADVRGLSFVRWAGRYEPAYKLEPEILKMVLAGESPEVKRYNVMLVDSRRDEPALVAAINEAGGRVHTFAHGNVLLEADLDTTQLLKVAAESTVLWIDRWSEPEEDMNNARIQGGANYIQYKKPEQYVGKGIRGMIMEGIYATHTEFAARSPYRTAPIVLGSSSPSGHGNATCGEVFARGVVANARGLCPYGQVIYSNYSYVYNNNNRYTLVSSLVDPAKSYRGMFQTASWGYSRIKTYTSRSAEMDRIIFDLDIPITQSQSNARDQMSRPQAWAKNIISVGATNHYDNSNPADDKWTSGSTGPAADGRVKPDLCAYYDKIHTTGYGSTSYTLSFGGTSGATPIVCGHLGLVIEMFTDGIFGHPMLAGGWTKRFENRPHFTTSKALLINGAVPYANPGRATKHDRYTQGWGFPNLQNLYDRRDRMLVIDELDVLTNRAHTTYYVFTPGSGTHGEFRVTMTYADPETAPITKIPHRINDLSLSVSGPTLFYMGNQGLSSSLSTNYSTAGGSADRINTVENVFIKSPPRGIYAVRVDASEVNADTHKETRTVDADFALVVSGITGGRDKSGLTLALTSPAAGDLRLSLTRLPAGWSFGHVVYSLDTSRPLGMGHFFGLEPDVLSFVTVLQPVLLGSPYGFKAGAGRVFPYTEYRFSSELAKALRGLTVDAVAFVADSRGTILDFSNGTRVTVK